MVGLGNFGDARTPLELRQWLQDIYSTGLQTNGILLVSGSNFREFIEAYDRILLKDTAGTVGVQPDWLPASADDGNFAEDTNDVAAEVPESDIDESSIADWAQSNESPVDDDPVNANADSLQSGVDAGQQTLDDAFAPSQQIVSASVLTDDADAAPVETTAEEADGTDAEPASDNGFVEDPELDQNASLTATTGTTAAETASDVMSHGMNEISNSMKSQTQADEQADGVTPSVEPMTSTESSDTLSLSPETVANWVAQSHDSVPQDTPATTVTEEANGSTTMHSNLFGDALVTDNQVASTKPAASDDFFDGQGDTIA